MEEQKPKGSGMEKIATFIVDKRNLFFLLYAFALIFSIVATGWVKVENDITTYLPEDTETRQGLTVMNDNFVTYGTARVMVSNVTYETAENICSDLESIDGVTSVDFDDTTDHYKSASALFSVTFDGTTTDDISIHALHTIRDMLAGYDTYIDTEVGVDTSADLQSEMSVILVLAAIVIVLVLVWFTGKTKMGKAMRACSEDKGAAQLMGINVNGTISLTFAIGSGLAAIAGVLLCSAYPTLVPTTGAMPGIKAFTAAVFGGIGSIPGAMLGGVLLGIIEIFAKAYISTQLSDAIVFAVLIVVLVVRPAGLLGKQVREKV